MDQNGTGSKPASPRLFFHLCIFITLIRMRIYIKLKEEMKWKGDMKGDNKMDFIHAFYPIFIFTFLYLIKICLIRVQYTLIKFVMAISVICLIILGETLFDSN